MFAIVTEDALSEAVARKLVCEAFGESQAVHPFRRGGNGYIKRNIPKFLELAERYPVFALTDLDGRHCPAVLLREWLPIKLPELLIFRVVVREVETWLLADRHAFAEYLGISAAKIRPDVEAIADPKRALLALATKARREIRADLLPSEGAAALQGFGYNSRLISFVEEVWDIDRASLNSPSLLKAKQRLVECKQLMAGRS